MEVGEYNLFVTWPVCRIRKVTNIGPGVRADIVGPNDRYKLSTGSNIAKE